MGKIGYQAKETMEILKQVVVFMNLSQESIRRLPDCMIR